MAALAVMMRRLSLAPPPAQKAACARLASRASAAFSAGTVTLRAAPPAQRVVAMPIVAKLRPKIDRPVKKLKTRKAAAKRYKVTASGKVMRRHAYKGHLLAHKSPKRKRFLSTESQVNHADIANVMDCLPYARIKH